MFLFSFLTGNVIAHNSVHRNPTGWLKKWDIFWFLCPLKWGHVILFQRLQLSLCLFRISVFCHVSCLSMSLSYIRSLGLKVCWRSWLRIRIFKFFGDKLNNNVCCHHCDSSDCKVRQKLLFCFCWTVFLSWKNKTEDEGFKNVAPFTKLTKTHSI